MSGYYIFKFEKSIVNFKKSFDVFSFLLKKRLFPAKILRFLTIPGKGKFAWAKMTISQKLFEIFRKIKKHVVPVFYSYHCAKFEHFWSSYSIQYSADHKKTAKNHNFISMCLYVIRPGRIPLFSNVNEYNIVFKYNLRGRC